MVAAGASLRQIGAALEAAGIRSNQGGQQWSPTMVKRAVERLQRGDEVEALAMPARAE